MTLESVMQREASQKESDKYCILTHTHMKSRNGMDDPISKAGIKMQTQSDMWTQSGKEVGRTGRLGLTCVHSMY